MKAINVKKIAAVSSAVSLALALLAASTGLKAEELYIDRPMPSYGAGAATNEPPLPEPGTWPQPEIAWEECAVPDTDGVQECFIAYVEGWETYYYIWEGKKYFHYPINEINRRMPSVPLN